MFSWFLNPVEKRVTSEMTAALAAMGGLSDEAAGLAHQLVRQAKHALLASGHKDIFDEGLGDRLFRDIGRLPQFAAHVVKLESMGVTKNDIRAWHNLSALERKVLLDTDVLIIMAFAKERATQVGDEVAAREAAMLYATYAWEYSEENEAHANPSLPAELKLRVNRYRDHRQLHDPEVFLDELRSDGYFNGHIRRRIAEGSLEY